MFLAFGLCCFMIFVYLCPQNLKNYEETIINHRVCRHRYDGSGTAIAQDSY